MVYRIWIVAMTVVVGAATSVLGGDGDFAVIGYLPDYRMASVVPERFTGITDLVYFSLRPPTDGQLPDLPIRPRDLETLREIKRATGCRILISVGGWNRSEGFPALAADSAARHRFVQGLLEFCRDHQLEGIDFDWEHPRNSAEMADYARLLVEAKREFADERLLVTVAQAGWQDLGKLCYEAVDRVHLMSYDHRFPHATLQKSTGDIDRLARWGCPPEKIALGLPFYGRNEQGDARPYDQLVGDRIVDPDTDTIQGYAFNGIATISSKVDLAMNRGLSGVMIWELGQDALRKEASLLSAIHGQIEHRRDSDESSSSLAAKKVVTKTTISPWRPAFLGVDICEASSVEPVRLQVRAVRVDLRESSIRFLVTPSNGADPLDCEARTTSQFLVDFGCQVAINGSSFHPFAKKPGDPQDVVGLSLSRGVLYSPGNEFDALMISRDRKAWIDQSPVEPQDAYNALSGFHALLVDGRNQGDMKKRHPRSAVGISKDGRYLYLMTIDGRQPEYSDGTTTAETAEWMTILGAHHALNLDGGGSTALVIEGADGKPRVLNRPSGKSERMVANHLGVFAERPSSHD